MSDLLERLAGARDHARPEPADEGELHRQWRRLEARRRRARTQRVLAAAVALLAVGALTLWPSPEPTIAETPIPSTNDAVDEADLRFAEGSGVHFLSDDTKVIPREVTGDRIRLTLERGTARFEVTPGLPREFIVDIDDARVAVVGTRFVVRRLGSDQVRIEVEEGRVRVRTPVADGEPTENLLSAGEALETRTRAPEPAEPAEPTDPAATREPSERAQRPRVAPRPPSTWRRLAEEGRFDEAYTALLQEDDLRNSDVGDLLLAADAARLSGHREEAVKFLREVLQHPDDPRTSLGAFTLGRVLLRSRPSEAAESFGFARRLDPDSSLAQDALAREVEAWYLAGRPRRARELAEEYVSRWPDGLRVDTVRRFGGLD